MLIALTGGIGSGKSTVAKRLVELGATEIDSDLLAREVVAPGTEGLAAVLEAFGEDLLVDGVLDRQRLAQRAFSTEQKRKQLEEILQLRQLVEPVVETAHARQVRAHARAVLQRQRRVLGDDVDLGRQVARDFEADFLLAHGGLHPGLHG